jgi:fibronectin-binding autotransporter adhesin
MNTTRLEHTIHRAARIGMLAAAALLPLGASESRGADSTWQNTGTDFNTPGNWSAGVPGAGNRASFDTAKVTDPNLSASLSIGQLHFTNTVANGYTLTAAPGQALTLASGTPISAYNGSGTNTIAANLILSGGGTKSFLQSGTGTLLLTGVISESTAGTGITFVRVAVAGPFFGASGLNTFTGNATLSDGTLYVSSIGRVGVAGALGKGSTFNFGSSVSSRAAKLVYTGPGETSDKVINLGTGTGSRTLDTTGATGGLVFTPDLTFNGSSAVTLGLTGDSVGNALSGTIGNPTGYATSVTKGGTGAWTLGGDNTYLGATTINASGGTLYINGNQSAATGTVTVSSGGTLGGTGTVGGATLILNGGKVSPGVDAGTLSFGGNLVLTNGSTVVFGGKDLVAVAGQLTLRDNWTLQLVGGFRDGGSVTLFTYGTLTASPDLAPTFNVASLGFTPSGALSLADTGSSIVLNGVQLPADPGTAVVIR